MTEDTLPENLIIESTDNNALFIKLYGFITNTF